MSRLLLRLARYISRHVCASCGRWIWSRDHRGEHAACYHSRRVALYQRGVAHWAPLDIPKWVDPCPDCGELLVA